MSVKLYLISIFVKVATCKIVIDVAIANSTGDPLITYHGSDVSLISDREIELFKVTDAYLRYAVKKHYRKSPSNVYLKSPTPWGDLYKTYNWQQVSRVLTAKSVKLTTSKKTPVLVLSQDFDNAFNNTIKVNTGISQTVENTLSTSWTKSHEVSVSQEIEYNLKVLLANLAGTTTFSYTSAWGESREKSESVTIGATSSVETELRPGQGATAVLSASKGRLELEVLYAATLRGNVAVNFKSGYKDHHFWGPSIDSVMKSGGLHNEIMIKETIKFGYYMDASLKVYDKASGLPL